MGPTKVVTIKDVEYDAWQWDGLDAKTLDLPDFLRDIVTAHTFGSNAYSSYAGRDVSRVARLYLRMTKPAVYDILLWPGDWALSRRTPGGRPYDQIFSLPNNTFVKATETIK